LWVYSGRRGVHCWVCDKEARQLSQSSRNSIAEYLTIIKGNEELTNKVNISSKQPLHPFVINSLAVIDIYFDQLFNDQEYLASPESCSKILSLISK
jgi:DNA primase small subunit